MSGSSGSTRPLSVAFRADASAVIGLGHVTRCIALAEVLRERGAEVLFVCRLHDGHMGALIEGRGFSVASLAPKVVAGGGDHLGDTWQADAQSTGAAIATRWPGGADWLVTDHYAIDARWEAAVRPYARSIMAIDDLADRRHDCDLLLDQNLVAGIETRYAGLVPDRCRMLLGPRFALLAPEYARLHEQVRPRQGTVRNVLVSFGGADPFGLTEKTMRAFISLGRLDVRLEVVVGRMASCLSAVSDLARLHSNIAVHSNLDSLAPLMARADLAVGAGGSTSWERLCLGLPSIVISVVDNQREICAELDRRGLALWLGDGSSVEETSLREAIRRRIDDPIAISFPAVDGLGAPKVAAVLLANADRPLGVRRAEAADEGMLLEWANDPVTRANGFNPNLITPDEHHRWYLLKLRDRDCRFYIVEALGTPVGQVRFDREGPDWTISYALAPPFRGRRLASRVLEAAMAKLSSGGEGGLLLALVKGQNVASRRVFEGLDFAASSDADGAIEYRRSLLPSKQ